MSLTVDWSEPVDARLPPVPAPGDPSTSQELLSELEPLTNLAAEREKEEGKPLSAPTLLRDGVQLFDVIRKDVIAFWAGRFDETVESLAAYKRKDDDKSQTPTGETVRYSFMSDYRIADPAFHHSEFARAMRDTLLYEIEQDLREFLTRYNQAVVSAQEDVEERANDPRDPELRRVGPGNRRRVVALLRRTSRQEAFNNARIVLQRFFREFLRVQVLYDTAIYSPAEHQTGPVPPRRDVHPWMRDRSGDTCLRGFVNLGNTNIQLNVIPSSHMIARSADLADIEIAEGLELVKKMTQVTVRPGQLVLYDSGLVRAMRLRKTTTKAEPAGFTKRLFGFALLLQTHNDFYAFGPKLCALNRSPPLMPSGQTERIFLTGNRAAKAFESWAGRTLTDAVSEIVILPKSTTQPQRRVRLPLHENGRWPRQLFPAQYGPAPEPYINQEISVFEPQPIHDVRPYTRAGQRQARRVIFFPLRKAQAERARGLQDQTPEELRQPNSDDVAEDVEDRGADARTEPQAQRETEELEDRIEDIGETPPFRRPQDGDAQEAADVDEDADVDDKVDGPGAKRKRSEALIGAMLIKIDEDPLKLTQDGAILTANRSGPVPRNASDVFVIFVREGGEFVIRSAADETKRVVVELTPQVMRNIDLLGFDESEPFTKWAFQVPFSAVSMRLGARTMEDLEGMYNVRGFISSNVTSRHQLGITPVRIERVAAGGVRFVVDKLYWEILAKSIGFRATVELAHSAISWLFASHIANQVGHSDVLIDFERWTSRFLGVRNAVGSELSKMLRRDTERKGQDLVRRALCKALSGFSASPVEWLPRVPEQDRVPFVYKNEEVAVLSPQGLYYQILSVQYNFEGDTELFGRVIRILSVSDGIPRAEAYELPPTLQYYNAFEDLKLSRFPAVAASISLSPVSEPDLTDFLFEKGAKQRERYNKFLQKLQV